MAKCKFNILYLDKDSLEAGVILEAVWCRIYEDGLSKSLFYDGSVMTLGEFTREIMRHGSLPFAVFCNGEIAAFSWLNCITGKMARTHFVVFKKFWGRRLHENMGRHLYEYILTRKDGFGYLFDCLYGLTPVSNKLAWKAAMRCGWKKIGEIPRACFMASDKKSETGILTCATREIMGIGEDQEMEWIWEL